ncbi:rhodanese-like domain-containing protein 8, chloroplastic isoform X1 [Triticum dicoccoides]|uniref:rhodanese-like domain-containing protein 8, chloroplastic isoform X1 n=1 Tax=Triticum dicoccoides TaxID=85692 RepID=UPI001890D651|nr:rhodanese-like domain-containing protein 8, chloroplastic isoform X1 [Triticum dicoccoides]
MAAAVHVHVHLHHHYHIPLLCPPPRRTGLFLSPWRALSLPLPLPLPPARLRSSFPAPTSHPAVAGTDEWEAKAEFVVVTFYKLVPVEDPRAEVAAHLHFLQGRDIDIQGRIYMNQQGINAQYSGPRKDAMAYADWVRKDRRFSDILIQISPALSGHAFPRLKLRYKQSLVQLEGGSCHLPLVEPSMRASPLTPSEWREKLEARKRLETGAPGDTSEGRKLLLLDVRNDYEWDIGHFEGAKRPNVDCFRSTSFGLSNSEQEMDSTDPLHGVDKENTDILMYCTGGIRCDVYSTILREKGFGNLYTLKGGVSNYLKSQGSAEWVGNLFVFDDRLSLPPAKFAEAEAAAEEGGADNGDLSSSRWLGRCYVCGSEVEELRHRNCASIDCNRLYLCCGGCLEELRGCCCSECMGAPRLRRLLPGHQRYDKWHLYRDDASTISS